MGDASRPRILVVDDEEAILETMAFTFEDEYEVLTARDARQALALLDERAPVAVAITDQRMPEMSGVEFLARVCEHHPNTTRIILTGFADLETIVDAINQGHVYAYVAKPWEPEELKQLVRRAVEHHRLLEENERLLGDLRRSNRFLETAMDEIPVGALAVDADDVVQAANRAAREYLGLEKDPRGRTLQEVLADGPLADLQEIARRSETGDGSQVELELTTGACCLRLRVGVRVLEGPNGDALGRVLLLREVSHEPLRWRFEHVLHELVSHEDGTRERMESALDELAELAQEVRGRAIQSPELAALEERLARTRTAVENWLAVDDTLAQEAYPDARRLLDRMRLAASRWPLAEALPPRVHELARRVEAYYESGENPRQHFL